MAERQTKYTIGEGLDLPSKGQIYPNFAPAQVELRSMTARDEMKRLSPSTTQFKNLAEIIEGCMIEKYPVHVYDMALGDYEYLLHRLRIVTYGDEYKIAVKCSNCGEIVETTAHLDELKVVEFDENKLTNNDIENLADTIEQVQNVQGDVSYYQDQVSGFLDENSH